MITVLGSINIDITCYAQQLPRPGETVHGERFAMALGGKGCNQAAAVAALGGDVTLLGAVGEDHFAVQAREHLKALGIDTDLLNVDERHGTGIAVIGVDANAQNAITVIGGANMALQPDYVERNLPSLDASSILLLQMETPLPVGLQAARRVGDHGGKVILDPAPAPIDGLPDHVFHHIDIITPNESETQALTGIFPTDENDAQQAAGLLLANGVSIAIIKLGARGVWFSDRVSGDSGFIPAFKVDSIESVAAGDCFNGGLAYALSTGATSREAVKFAAACGALSTTRAGASASAPGLGEVQGLLAGN